MFNGMLKSDDVEVYEGNNVQVSYVALSENCKSNIICQHNNGNGFNLSLPVTSNVGKIINITSFYYYNNASKSNGNSGVVYIQHSNTTLFTLKQGTVSFMYVGQQLNGLTTTDKAKSGWIILGGVQGDTAITGFAGSVAIGSGAYCGGIGTTIGQNSNATDNCVTVGKSASSANSGDIAIGDSCVLSGQNAVLIGYSATSAAGQYTNGIGRQVYSGSSKISLKCNNQFSVAGDAQAGKFIIMRQTTDATPLVLSATNAAASTTNILILPNNGTYAFKGIVVAKDASTLDSAMWEVTALMKRGANASTTALVGTPTVTKVFNDAGASAWAIALTADTTNGGGAITVTGEAGKTIRWVSNIDSAEVI